MKRRKLHIHIGFIMCILVLFGIQKAPLHAHPAANAPLRLTNLAWNIAFAGACGAYITLYQKYVAMQQKLKKATKQIKSFVLDSTTTNNHVDLHSHADQSDPCIQYCVPDKHIEKALTFFQKKIIILLKSH